MNYKNILFQFFAGLFFVVGFKQFFIFRDLELLELINSMGKESFLFLAEKSNSLGISNQLQELNHSKIILGFVAVMINYVVLAVIAFKCKINANIAIVISCILAILHFFKMIDLSPISFIKMNLVAAYILPAILSLSASFLFYFLAIKTSRN